jgi:hypothetical protein
MQQKEKRKVTKEKRKMGGTEQYSSQTDFPFFYCSLFI